jgi:hypothetical protein
MLSKLHFECAFVVAVLAYVVCGLAMLLQASPDLGHAPAQAAPE